MFRPSSFCSSFAQRTYRDPPPSPVLALTRKARASLRFDPERWLGEFTHFHHYYFHLKRVEDYFRLLFMRILNLVYYRIHCTIISASWTFFYCLLAVNLFAVGVPFSFLAHWFTRVTDDSRSGLQVMVAPAESLVRPFSHLFSPVSRPPNVTLTKVDFFHPTRNWLKIIWRPLVKNIMVKKSFWKMLFILVYKWLKSILSRYKIDHLSILVEMLTINYLVFP